jgi:hypothetical protein
VQGRAWCHTSAFAIPNFDFPPKDLCEKARMQHEPRLAVIGGESVPARISPRHSERSSSPEIG